MNAASPVLDPPVEAGIPCDLGTYRLEEQVGFFLRRANQRHAAIFLERMPEDLTPTQWAALVKVAELLSVSQNQLGRDTAMDAATIKGVIDRLLKRGFVSTGPDPADGRRTLIALAPAGRAAVEAGLVRAAEVTEATLRPLAAHERKTLLDLLRRIS